MTGEFYCVVTLIEILNAVFDVSSKRGLLVVQGSGAEVLMDTRTAENYLRALKGPKERIYVVCTQATKEELASVKPPPNFLVDVPTEAGSCLEQTWMSFKLSEIEAKADCGKSLVSAFRAVVRRIKPHLRGHVEGYFDYDPSARAEYTRIRYSDGALDLFHSGMKWKDGSVMLEPAE